MKTAIIILNYKDYQATADCIASVNKSDLPLRSTIYVVDNSNDPARQRLLQKQHPHIKIIKNRRNYGFAKGNNIGIKMAIKDGASHLLILNPDASIPKVFFKPLLNHLNKDPKIALIAPGHLHNNQITLGGFLNRFTGMAKHQTIKRIRNKSTLTFHDYVSFACVLLKADVVKKVGLLNDQYFMYFEDVEYCLKLRSGGYSIAADPSVLISHQTSSSFSSSLGKLKYLVPSHFRFIINNLHGINKLTALVYQSLHYPYLYLLWTHHHWRYRPISTT